MDFKKTILWAVFSLSGLMLYNNWQVHEGKPSMFGGASNVTATATDKAGSPKLDMPAAISGVPATPQAPNAKTIATESTEKFTLEKSIVMKAVTSVLRAGGHIFTLHAHIRTE
jgi:YidC/Oxa1 family membrane protein insertase